MGYIISSQQRNLSPGLPQQVLSGSSAMTEIKNQQQREELSDQDLNLVTGGGTPAPAPPPKTPPPKSTLKAEFPSADHKDW